MVLDAILPVVSRSSNLALRLYQVAAVPQQEAKQLIETAKVTNSFALNLKQVGTLITENDRLPSPEALDSLEDIIDQARSVLSAIDAAISTRENGHGDIEDGYSTSDDHAQEDRSTATGLVYPSAHLEALRATLSLQLQTLYTAQSIMWTRLRPTISPQQAAKTVRSERLQLEALIIDQQMSILCASRAYGESPRADGRLLMETDSSQSLVSTAQRDGPKPSDLYRYTDRDVAVLDAGHSEAAWLPTVSSVKSSQADRLLKRWTSLAQFESRLRAEETNAQKQKQEMQQATVESDSEEDNEDQAELADDGARRTQGRSGSVQPLFAEPNGNDHYGPAAPPSPASTPRTSRNSLNASFSEHNSPTTPRSSIGSLPVEAAAAIEAKEEDEDVDLEIPWKLCTRRYYWKYIDAKQVGSNTDQNPSLAFLERYSWTEIMASWVCKEAIREAGFKFTQVQKDRKDGRRTKLETCFCIEKPLQFDQVKQLVERTVDLYRKTAPPTPPPSHTRRSSFQRPPPVNAPKPNVVFDRSRTPMPRNTHPPLERANSAVPHPPPPPPGPPPLDRSLSTPGPEFFPPTYPPPKHQAGSNPRSSNLQIPIPPGPYTSQPPPSLHSPRLPQYPPQNGGYPAPTGSYPTQPMYPQSPQFAYPPTGLYSNSLPPHVQPQFFGVPQSPLRQPYMTPSSSGRYDDRDLTTSDSESAGRDRSRRHRSKSRSRYSSEKKRKSHKTSKAVGAVMGVGGLTALLDTLSGL